MPCCVRTVSLRLLPSRSPMVREPTVSEDVTYVVTPVLLGTPRTLDRGWRGLKPLVVCCDPYAVPYRAAPQINALDGVNACVVAMRNNPTHHQLAIAFVRTMQRLLSAGA